MPRELRVNATVVLPDGTFEEAAALVALKPIVETFKAGLTACGSMDWEVGVTFDMAVVRPRGEKEPTNGGGGMTHFRDQPEFMRHYPQPGDTAMRDLARDIARGGGMGTDDAGNSFAAGYRLLPRDEVAITDLIRRHVGPAPR
jgi:hypothetical protein